MEDRGTFGYQSLLVVGLERKFTPHLYIEEVWQI